MACSLLTPLTIARVLMHLLVLGAFGHAVSLTEKYAAAVS